MVVNFRAREISRGACKLTQTPTLKKKKKTIVHLLNNTKKSICILIKMNIHINKNNSEHHCYPFLAKDFEIFF